ncbi:MAG: hypothetical protein NBV63_03180, partial [Candidatus Pacebacteria bacterium]|nr:hypothetical protein [Candidatus Paceibacterota bacterium]
QDVERGVGVVILDVSGNLSPLIMERLTTEQLDRVVHLDAADAEYPFSWNIPNEFRHTPQGSALFVEALASVYGVTPGPLLAFLASHIQAHPNKTILDPFLLMSEQKERDAAFPPESGEAKECASLMASDTATVDALVENGKFLMKDTMVRNLLGQKDGKFALSDLAAGKIFVVDLSRVRIFPTRIAPLVKLFTYASRTHASPEVPVALYLHDGLRYLSERDSEALLTDQALSLTLSDTVYRETDLPLREKVLTRCGSVITFEPHQTDIPLVQRVFYPFVSSEELQGLEEGEACVMLTIDAVRARPFFAHTLPLPERRHVSLQDILVEARKRYTLPRTQVDELFKKRTEEDKKKGQPPFSDAFKNIFAKRDPSKALAQGTDKKGDPAKPQAETGLAQSVARILEPTKSQQAHTGATTALPQEVIAREIPEDDLRELLYAPLPA